MALDGGSESMKKQTRILRLNRETVRDLAEPGLSEAMAGQALTNTCGRLTIPPTVCGCTGTETTEICETIGIFTCVCGNC
jgi:hypothetical protein